MNKQVCILLVALVPVTFSCCIPMQWEGIQEVSVGDNKEGKAMYIQALYNASFDAKAMKVFLNGTVTVDDKMITETILQDYKMGNQYVVTDGQCTMSKLTDPFPQYCTSPHGMMELSTYVGTGMDKMTIEVYKMTEDMNHYTHLTVTKDSCIPLSAYRRTLDQIYLVNYMGITPGIVSSKVFDVPKPCMYATNVSPIVHEKDYRRALFVY